LIVVISGPGGVGKGTVVRKLLELDDDLWLSRSWTTRQQRPGEPDDAYEFVTRSAFQAKVDAGGFLEWAEFLDNMYGTPVPEAPEGKDVLLEIEVQGAAQVLDRDPGALLIGLFPPSHEEQEARMRGRGDDDEARIHERLHAARHEMAEARRLGAHEVVNDDLDRATAEVHTIIRDARRGQR
jgi:guanylate kinase